MSDRAGCQRSSGVEQFTRNDQVKGSIPFAGFFPNLQQLLSRQTHEDLVRRFGAAAIQILGSNVYSYVDPACIRRM